MNIVVSADKNKDVKVFPIVPREIELKNPSKNEEFQTVNNGTINIIGDLGLREISISSIFLKERKTWAKAGSEEGQNYIAFFEKYRAKKVPFRLIITRDNGSEWVNMECTVENFDYSYDRQENIRYTLDFKEYVSIF